MNFVANMASFSNDKYQCDGELAVNLVNEIMPLTSAKDKAVRFRSCQLASKLLNRCVPLPTVFFLETCMLEGRVPRTTPKSWRRAAHAALQI